MQQKAKNRLRFAPSPNGYLHLGHAYSALLNYRLAGKMSADFLLRMEDIDHLRCPQKYKDAMLEDLKLIGVETGYDIVEQSRRQHHYQKAIEQLSALGVLYPCLASRKDIATYYKSSDEKRDPDGALIYPELYKDISDQDKQAIYEGDKPYALRLDMAKAVQFLSDQQIDISFEQAILDESVLRIIHADPQVWGDVVIARKDIDTSYHLSCVIDDSLQNITHVIRGKDLYKATYVHVVLQKLLKLPTPCYYHHDLLLDDSLKKLSKSYGSDRFALSLNDGDIEKNIEEMLNVSFMDKIILKLYNIFNETSTL